MRQLKELLQNEEKNQTSSTNGSVQLQRESPIDMYFTFGEEKNYFSEQQKQKKDLESFFNLPRNYFSQKTSKQKQARNSAHSILIKRKIASKINKL